jgi:hypothetical protein
VKGRPPLDRRDRSVAICVTLPSRQYDRLYQRAQRAKVSVPEVVRRQLTQKKYTK